MQKAVLFLVLFVIYRPVNSQSLNDLSRLVTVTSIDEGSTILFKQGFTFNSTEDINKSGRKAIVVYFTKNDYSHNSTLTVGIYKADKDKPSYTVQIISYSDALFMDYKKELESNNGTEFKKEYTSGRSYNRDYIKDDYLYNFSIVPSDDHPGKNLTVISISNLADFR